MPILQSALMCDNFLVLCTLDMPLPICFAGSQCPLVLSDEGVASNCWCEDFALFLLLNVWALSWPVGCGRSRCLYMSQWSFYLFYPSLGVSSHPRGVCGSPGDSGVRLDPGHSTDGVLVVERGAWPHLLDGLHESPVSSGPPLPHPRSDAPQDNWWRALPHSQVSWGF